MFRVMHREARLRPLLSGREPQEDVRPLSLTAPLQKIINIKDVISQVVHEEPSVIPRHAPSLS
jgi:hypothetical protein